MDVNDLNDWPFPGEDELPLPGAWLNSGGRDVLYRHDTLPSPPTGPSAANYAIIDDPNCYPAVATTAMFFGKATPAYPAFRVDCDLPSAPAAILNAVAAKFYQPAVNNDCSTFVQGSSAPTDNLDAVAFHDHQVEINNPCSSFVQDPSDPAADLNAVAVNIHQPAVSNTCSTFVEGPSTPTSDINAISVNTYPTAIGNAYSAALQLPEHFLVRLFKSKTFKKRFPRVVLSPCGLPLRPVVTISEPEATHDGHSIRVCCRVKMSKAEKEKKRVFFICNNEHAVRCRRVCAASGDMSNHQKSSGHGMADEAKGTCPKCGGKFPRGDSLKRHLLNSCESVVSAPKRGNKNKTTAEKKLKAKKTKKV